MTLRALYAGLAVIGLGSAMAQALPADTLPVADGQPAVFEEEQADAQPAVFEEEGADAQPAVFEEEGADAQPAVFEEEGADESAESDSSDRKRRPRDPFRPFTLDLRPVDTDDQPLTPLQRYELAQLRVSAVLLNLTPPRALLEDNSGMGFIVTPGTPIGRRRGVVAAIESRTVIVEERALDFYGHEQVKRVAMEMGDEGDVQGGIQE